MKQLIIEGLRREKAKSISECDFLLARRFDLALRRLLNNDYHSNGKHNHSRN